MNRDTAIDIAGALWSPNEHDSNGEQANVVDGLFAIARAINRLAKAVEDQAPRKQTSGTRIGPEGPPSRRPF